MENFAPLMHGVGVALTTYHVALMIVGVLLGILVGVLPGLGAPNGVSLLLPLTFTMDPVSAIILLSSMYWGALFGGSTTSILFKSRENRHLPRRPSMAIGWPGQERPQRLRLSRFSRPGSVHW